MGDGAARNGDAQGSAEGEPKTSKAEGGQEEMEGGLSLSQGKHICFVLRLHSPYDVAWGALVWSRLELASYCVHVHI